MYLLVEQLLGDMTYTGYDIDVFCESLCKHHDIVFSSDSEDNDDQPDTDNETNVKVPAQGNRSHIMRKPVFRLNGQVQHKLGCSATEDG